MYNELLLPPHEMPRDPALDSKAVIYSSDRMISYQDEFALNEAREWATSDSLRKRFTAYLRRRFPKFSEDDIEDVVHDTMVKLLRCVENPTENLKSDRTTYSYRVLANTAIDYCRKKPKTICEQPVEDLQKIEDSGQSLGLAYGARIAESWSDVKLRIYIEQLFEQMIKDGELTQEEVHILILKFDKEFSYAEVAEALSLKMSPEALKKRIQRLQVKIKRYANNTDQFN